MPSAAQAPQLSLENPVKDGEAKAERPRRIIGFVQGPVSLRARWEQSFAFPFPAHSSCAPAWMAISIPLQHIYIYSAVPRLQRRES